MNYYTILVNDLGEIFVYDGYPEELEEWEGSPIFVCQSFEELAAYFE